MAPRAKGQHNRFLQDRLSLRFIRYHQYTWHVLSTACPNLSATALGIPTCLSFADATAAIGQVPNENRAAINADR
jgi:hypothetical protein